MKKRIFILTLLVSIFSSAQIFAFGVKVDGDFGGKTSLCDLGVVFNNSKQTALFSTGICFGAIKAPVKEEITIDKGYLYGGSYTEKVVVEKAFPVFFSSLPCSMPQSVRILSPPASSRYIEPVTKRAAPRNVRVIASSFFLPR